jgi:hypothetical protein
MSESFPQKISLEFLYPRFFYKGFTVESIYHPMRCTQKTTTAVGAHCGCADQGLEMDPRSRSRLVERTAVGEGG